MKRLLALIIIISTLFGLTSCGKENYVVIEKLNIHKMTVRKSSLKDKEEQIEKNEALDNIEIEKEYLYDDSTIASELILINNDTSKEYSIINNSDIYYIGRTYENLYKNINSIGTPFDKNTLINFIIKTYNANESKVYSLVTFEVTPNINAEENNDISFDELLSNNEKYKELKLKYNENIQWELSIHTMGLKNQILMYGCDKYILLVGIDEPLKIDMNTYKVQ